MRATVGPAPTLAQIIDNSALSPLQIRVIVLCALVAFVDGYDLQTLALAVPTLSDLWHLAPATFKFAQSASLLGIALGSIFLGPLGDSYGRKPVLVGGLLFMGVSSLGVVLASTPDQLVFWRTLVGIGYGAIHGNATALTAEYSPLRRRAMLMTLMGCNVAFGALIAGLTAPWVIHHLGWQGMFLIGGAIPVALSVLMLAVPESLQLLATRHPDDPRIADILRRIAPGVVPAAQVATPRQRRGKLSLLFDLLRPPLRERTLRLWLLYGFNTFLLYLLISWLPVLLKEAGWGRDAALLGIVLFQLGGIIGALALAWAIDRGHTIPALIGSYLVGAGAASLFAVAPATSALWPALLVALGGGISGAMFALMALGAVFYPPAVRGTGFSWTAAVSRLSAFLGPLAGGWVLAMGVPATRIIALLAIPAAISAVLALSLTQVLRRARLAESPSPPILV